MTVLSISVSHVESLDSVRLVDPTDDDISSFASIVIERTFPESKGTASVLTADEYPLLAAIWDNEDDAIYDDM